MSDYFDHIERHLLDALERRAGRRTATVASSPPARRRPRAIGTRRGWALLAAVIVLAGAAFVFGLGGPGGRVPDAGPQSASAELGRLATVAGAQPQEALGGGVYAHWVVEHHGRLAWPGCVVDTRIRDEVWEGSDGSGFTRTTVSPPSAGGDGARCRARAATEGREEGLGVVESAYAPSCLTFLPPSLDKLPEGAAAIRRALLGAAARHSTRTRPIVLLGLIAQRLSWRGLSPGQRSDLFEIAAALPGIQLLGPTSDPQGRRGVGLAAEADGVRLEVVFDPSSSALLAQRVTQSGGGGAREQSWQTYRPIQVVGGLPAGAPRHLHPACRLRGGTVEGTSSKTGPHLWVETGPR